MTTTTMILECLSHAHTLDLIVTDYYHESRYAMAVGFQDVKTAR